MVKRPETSYEERFDEVMRYVKMRLMGQGGRITLKNKEELRQTILRLDEARQTRGKKKISEKFLKRILETEAAQRVIGKTLGRFQKKRRPFTKREQEKIAFVRRAGVEVFLTTQGNPAQKSVFTSKRGVTLMKFRDLTTGRFVARTEVTLLEP